MIEKIFLSIFVLLFTLISPVKSIALDPEPSTEVSPTNLVGRWKYIGHYYEDQFQNPLNPDLILTFEFFEDGTDILRWERKNEPGFCERKGQYTYDGDILTDQVIWLNPNNSFECGKDPDMRLNNKTQTHVSLKSEIFFMDLPLGDKKLVYVWQRQPKESSF